jgi:hypothetical protein
MQTRLLVAGGIAVALAGCGRRESRTPHRSEQAAAPGISAATTTASGPCAANGRWAVCSVLQRLDRAGLAPRRDSGTVAVRPLIQPAVRVHVGRSDMEIFVYADSAARARDAARLDRGKYISAAAQPTIRREATLIESANLLAILHSSDDHQRERVSDALTAGPPQPGVGR